MSNKINNMYRPKSNLIFPFLFLIIFITNNYLINFGIKINKYYSFFFLNFLFKILFINLKKLVKIKKFINNKL